MKKIYIIPLIIILLTSCQPTVISEFEDFPVVEGFMFNGAELSLRISKLIPFRDDVSYSPENIDNLSLTVRDITMGKDYSLILKDSGVYVSGTDFLPEAGHAYRLSFTYNGGEVKAETQIADIPQNVVLSKEKITALSMDNFQPGSGGFPEITNDSLVVSWDNPNRDYYFVIIENIEEDPTAINTIFGRFNGNNSQLFRTNLSQESSVTIQSMQFGYYGRYLAHVCRLQPEYVTLLQHNSETLTEVFANVEGGYGVFTGISACSVEFTVVEEE